MPRLKATVSYDGTHFSGYQVQPEKRTVQLDVETALMKMHKDLEVRVTASGRTDAGVHAVGQVLHFDSPLNIPEANWQRALNTLLPDDIWVKRVERVPDTFHARFDVKKKEYRFKLLNRPTPDLFRRNYTVHVPEALNLEKMKEAAQWIIGTHDYSSFCAANTSVVDKVRTVYNLDILKEAGDEMHIRIQGSGFLYQMVRIVAGQLISVGKGKADPGEMKTIIEAKDRRVAYPTAPPQGLYLWRVDY